MKPALPAPISGFTCPPAPALPARFHLPSCAPAGFHLSSCAPCRVSPALLRLPSRVSPALLRPPFSGFTCPPAPPCRVSPALLHPPFWVSPAPVSPGLLHPLAKLHLPSCAACLSPALRRFPGFTCPPASLPWVSTKDDLVWPVTSGTRGMVQIGCDFWGKPAMTCDFWEWGSGNTGVTCDFWASAQETRA